jgi:FkbM family methyltransferase
MIHFLLKLANQLNTFTDLRNGIARTSYSQQAEDLFLQDYFGDNQKGFYIDIGAFDPVKYSNTHSLFKQGWSGINIDPNPETIEKFNEQRPADINLNIGISSENISLKYYMFNNPAVNSFSTAHVEMWRKQRGFKVIKEIEVQTTTLFEIAKSHKLNEIKVDMMNVDVEGLGVDVIQSNDWDFFRPKLIVLEIDNIYSSDFSNNESIQYLKSVGYGICRISGITAFFIDQREDFS